MNDKHTRGTTQCGHLEFIGPASIIGHRLIPKEAGGRRIVNEHEQHLARHIHILKIIPVVLRRNCAVPNENKFSVQFYTINNPLRKRYVVSTWFKENNFAILRLHLKRLSNPRRDSHKWNGLNISAIRITRL